MDERIAAFKAAQELVDPIVDKHGLEKVMSTQGLGFTSSIAHTPSDQHLGHILDVADWLLGKDR